MSLHVELPAVFCSQAIGKGQITTSRKFVT